MTTSVTDGTTLTLAIIPENYRPEVDISNIGMVGINGVTRMCLAKIFTGSVSHGIIGQSMKSNLSNSDVISFYFEYYL